MHFDRVVLDMRFHRPLRLSSTQQAVTFIPEKTVHGQTPDNRYYLIRYSEIDMVGKDDFHKLGF